MEIIHRTRHVAAAIAVAFVWSGASALAGDVSLRAGGAVPIGSLPSGGLSIGAGNSGASANTQLDLNPLADDHASASTNFQSNPLTVPDALGRFSIRAGDGKANVSVIYKFVKTKF